MFKTLLSQLTLMVGIFLTACTSSPNLDEIALIPEGAILLEEAGKAKRVEIIQHVEGIKSGNGEISDLYYWPQMTAAAGREDLIATIDHPQYERFDFICAPRSDADPIEQITQLAEQTSLVIINEHHARPAHRVFIRQLLSRLHEIGFTHYAAETMSEGWLDRDGYPRIGDGYFTTEPMMARLFHHADGLGFDSVYYEMRPDQMAAEGADMMEQIATREEAQAQNLMDAVLSDNPDTKIIIHVGHGHVAETPVPDENGVPWMAARLKAKSGIDPLTISLTDCRSASNDAVLSLQAKEPGGLIQPMHTDFLVGLPALKFTYGRPNYRYEIGDRPVDVPERLKPDAGSVLIEARPVGADLDQQPVERLYLSMGEDIPLMLPPGNWSVVSFGNDGEQIGETELVVSD